METGVSTAHPHSPVKSGGIHLAADKIILLFRETCSENLFSVVMSAVKRCWRRWSYRDYSLNEKNMYKICKYRSTNVKVRRRLKIKTSRIANK